MARWVEDIVQALKNLGGVATEAQIFEEVRRSRGGEFPRTWHAMIHHTICDHSSDAEYFKGQGDYFRKVDKGVWALRVPAEAGSFGKIRLAEQRQALRNEASDREENEYMASWVEDIIQALKNLGGQANLAQIYEEVKRIRTEPLPDTYKASIRERIEAHSSDSLNFKGMDHFRKVGKGVWALREPISGDEEEEDLATWVEDIIQALINLGGQAPYSQIYEEVKRVRKGPFPTSWQFVIQGTIETHSSDSKKFNGKDYFRKVDKGVWALRNPAAAPKTVQQAPKQKDVVPHHYLPPESFEEIANILRTIKQYRDYQHPDSPSWKEYVDEFFHILGFSTDGKSQRLVTLSLMGMNHTPRAIVCYVNPGENFDEIAPGLEWESYLFYAAKFHQIDWGILTDGLRLRIIHFKDQDNKQPSYWPDLDGVVCQEKLDTFCAIYKVFSFIKGYDGKSAIEQEKPKRRRRGI